MTGRRGVFWPLVLIALGLVFLLANFGYIPSVSLFVLLSLWPLLLVLAGIDLAFARRWPLPTLAAELGVIALGLVLVAAQPPLFPGGWFGFAVSGGGESDITVPRDGAASLSLRINGGAGSYRLSGGSTQLVESHSDRSDLRLRRSERTTKGVEVRIDQGADSGPRFGPRGSATVDTKIASDVPTSLDLNYGAGEFVIDLRDVRVTDARINAGASSLDITLPRPTEEVSMTINAGASNVVVVVPDGVEVRITTSGAILSLRSENPRVNASGSTAETSGYSAARGRVTLRITAGASSVTVR